MTHCTVYIFRHGETEWNRLGRAQGHTDIPLNETGKQQAQELATRLAQSNIQAILSSDLSRALETGTFVAEALRIPIITTPELREICLGEAEGMTREESAVAFGQDLVDRCASRSKDIHAAFPGGETRVELLARTAPAIHKFIEETDYTCIGVSTHGGVLRTIVHSYATDLTEPIPIPNCVAYKLNIERHSKVITFAGAYPATISV